MLIKCKSALLLTDVLSFRRLYEQLAKETDVALCCEEDWSERFRVTQDVVILGSKYLSRLNKIYYPSAVLILKAGESPYPYIKEGIIRFIFDYQNQYELFMAFFKEEPVYVSYATKELKDLVKAYNTSFFKRGAYDFDFLADSFKYKGKQIYLAKSQKKYLAEWLLNGHKDNKKRMLLCSLRKKFGAEFLSDVNRFGEIKEDKDE